MTNTTSEQTRTTAPRLDPRGYGVLGRLGLAVARHRRATLVVWGGLSDRPLIGKSESRTAA